MGLGDLFKLAKLTIESFKESARDDSTRIGDMEVMYNPETLTLRHESAFQGLDGAKQPIWTHQPPADLTVKLVFDGTNVSSFGVEQLLGLPTVGEQIKKFLDLCYKTQSPTHEPAYLRLKWHQDVLGDGFDGRLQSVDIQYTAFDRDGAPLRAELTAKFVLALHPPKADAMARNQSPDLTHRRVVRVGDTLPALCREVYGSPLHHVRVAQINGLDDLRGLTPGQELVFPPFARKERR